MSKHSVEKDVAKQDQVDSLKGTLFSTFVFVGGGLAIFMITLFFFYMIRI